MVYTSSEDEIMTISIHPYEEGIDAIEPKNFRVYGPECCGCTRHGKALMISYMVGDTNIFYDVFLDNARAQSLLGALSSLPTEKRKVLSLNGDYIVRFSLYIDQGEVKLRPTAAQWRSFLEDIVRNQDKILERAHNPEANLDVLEPRRLTPEELQAREKRVTSFLNEYYKPDPSDVPIKGIDMGTLLAALYNNASSGGVGLFQSNDRQISPEEGGHLLCEIERLNALPEIDYINGRALKVYFNLEAQNPKLCTTRYWDYNGLPVLYIIAAAKRGLFTELSSNDIIELENDVLTIFREHPDLLSERDQARTIQAGKDRADFLNDYPSQDRRNLAFAHNADRRDYQLSICGNGRVRGEIGEFIRPFFFPLTAIAGTDVPSPKP